MAVAGSTASPQTTTPGSLRGERRIVTTLFADVVNSTALAEKLDPEDWTEIMNGAFERLTAPVHRYDGTVARLMGDGMLAFFGAPVSHEDDPQRAVLAGLDILDAIRDYAKTLDGLEFSVRVGINTGSVVMADVGSAISMEFTAMGDAVNVAARMQSTAAPGTLQVADETWRLIAPLFEATALGPIELKGKSEPVEAWRVTGIRGDPGRSRRGEDVGAPLIGREKQLGALKAAVDRVRQGRGGIVCLIGEAGLGKSRLLTELKRYWLEQDPDTAWDLLYGIPYDTARPYGLFQNYARGMFGIGLDDTATTIHQKVRDGILAQGGNDEIAALCSVSMERVIAAKVLHEGKSFPAEVIRDDIYNVMDPAFRQSCHARPSVCVIDDLHWSDPASIELLLHLMSIADDSPLLMIFAFRPERQSPAWQVKLRAETDFPHLYTELALSPLDASDTKTLVGALLQVSNLPPELLQLIARKTDGNPYFAEEVIRSLIDQGVIERTGDGLRFNADARLTEVAIPDSLQTLLMARIDRLDEETRSTLQMASVIGRSFYYRILQAISESALAVDKHLRSLERVELLRESGRLPELEYMFRHELARDAAYATILNRRRRSFHRQVGEAMETLFAERLEEHAHRLAQHFERAGDDAKAAKYFEMAGDVGRDIHALEEAGENYGRALEAAVRAGADPAAIARLEAAKLAVAT